MVRPSSWSQRDLVGVGVPAEPGVGLVEGHAVALCQDIGGDQAGHAAADDCDGALEGVGTFHICYSDRQRVRMGSRD